jgi:hypothetical protein
MKNYKREDGWLSAGMLRRVLWQILTDISEKLTAPVLMMVAVSSHETSVKSHFSAQHPRRQLSS